jgi:hypothetical protein
MPAPPIDAWAARGLQQRLHERHGLTHLRVRKRGLLLTVESGPSDDAHPHVRFRRDTVHLWRVEAASRGKWERTHLRATLDELLDTLTTDFPWLLQSLDENPVGTSDRED